METSHARLAAFGLTDLLATPALFIATPGTVFGPLGFRAVAASPEFMRGLRHVLERERGGAWRQAMKSAGQAHGRAAAVRLDQELQRRGQPLLAALPLDASLALLERVFAASGWGQLSLDLSQAAEHGLVVARLEQSCFAEAFAGSNDFADALPAGMLQAFFEHISGQALGCEEIACQARGAPACVFVLAAAERLAPLLPLLGRESADSLIDRLSQ
jgi:predicted hydrocarbon binding protein